MRPFRAQETAPDMALRPARIAAVADRVTVRKIRIVKVGLARQ